MTVGISKHSNRNLSDLPPKGLITQEEILSAFESHLNGDKSIDVYDLFRAIAAQTAAGNKAFTGRPLQWESDCLQKWHRQFKYGVSMTPLSDYDTRQRVTSSFPQTSSHSKAATNPATNKPSSAATPT